MHRFFVQPQDIIEDTALIRGEELQHLSRVLRLDVGEAVIIFDGLGREYQGSIEALNKGQALVRVGPPLVMPRESFMEVLLVQGLAKGEKMEFIIQKNTELGVKGFIPLEGGRSIVKLDEKRKREKEIRWQRVAMEAAKQCRRAFVPVIHKTQRLEDFLQGLPQERILLIPWEEGGASLKEVLAMKEPDARQGTPVYILIGPEGGMELEDVKLAHDAGGIPVTLGPRILRTETAGMAAVAAIMYQWGDLG